MDLLTVPNCRLVSDPADPILEGVRLPRSVLVFDVRSPEDASPAWRAPYGEHLYSTERAAYSLGLRRSWAERYDVEPLNSSGWHTFPEGLRSLRHCLARVWRDYRRATTAEEPAAHHGASVYSRPVAIAIGNYGGAVICDSRDSRRIYFT